MRILGPYAQGTGMETLMASKSDRHPTELARLQGARLVSATETEEGRSWAESRIKMMSGEDTITARYMRCDFFDYWPRFKLVISGNHKPSLRTVDIAIRRRLHILPFTVTIPSDERDPLLKEKLRAEWPGILQWAIDGCVEWQRQGLNPPTLVRDATESYFADEDAVGRWMLERCELGANYWTASSALFGDWKEWAERAGEEVGSQKNFSQVLLGREGIKKHDYGSKRGFDGIRFNERLMREE
jgi:putative DNA primase/helicase